MRVFLNIFEQYISFKVFRSSGQGSLLFTSNLINLSAFEQILYLTLFLNIRSCALYFFHMFCSMQYAYPQLLLL